MKFSIVRTDKNHVVHLSTKTAEWFMGRIQTDTKAGDIAKLRQHVDYFGNTKDYYKLHSIAEVYPSVELEKTANGNLEIVAFNSLVTLHIGNMLREEDLLAVKEAAKQLPMTFATFVGADGRSVEIIVAVRKNENGQSSIFNLPSSMTEAEMDEFCKKSYETVVSVYSGLLPQPIEHQTVSARSHFLMTFDPAPYYNPSPTPLKITTTSQARGTEAEANSSLFTLHSSLNPDMSLYAVYEQMFQRAVEEAYEETADVVESQQWEAYLTDLVLRLCDMGVPEEETFLHLSNHYVYRSYYDEDTVRSIVSAVYAERKPKRMEVETVSRETRRLINFLNTRYVFRYNTVMGYTEYRPNNTWLQDWQPCDENAVNGITIEAQLANLDVRDKDVRRYVRSNKIRPYDPIGDYLTRVSDKWDGKTDHIAMLARQVPCDLPQWEQWFRKWFLSMVAQWLTPHQEYGNSVVPLLISPQGDGKTTFCRNILPKELRWGFLENLDISEKRQTLQAMHNFLLINLDEFNQISPKLQEGFLKNVIQLPNVKIKRPYGKHVEEFKRYASFIATTNESSVLSDPTGNRRFICIQLTAPINTAYKPNYEALYGQAYTLIMSHEEQWWFTPDEVKAIIHHNRHFEVTPPAIQYFNEYYDIAADEGDGQWQTATAIYDRLRSIAGSGLKANGVAAFGRYLKNIPGIQQKRITNGRVYLVKEK
jgi:hypothetical protein